MSHTYLTTQELSERIKYNPRTIRNELKDSVLIEGIHYIRPFGGRKILYVWEEIEKDEFFLSEGGAAASAEISVNKKINGFMRTGITGSINAMALQ